MFTHAPLPAFDLSSKDTLQGRFYTTPLGDKYPSITTVLGSENKKWLEEWRASVGPVFAAAEQKRGAERGTAFHELVECYLKNQDLPEADIQHAKLFRQVRLHLNKISNIRLQEAALWSDVMRIAGRVDCVADYDGVLSLIDFKTANKPRDVWAIEDYYLQCTAYALMVDELYDIQIDQLVIIMGAEQGIGATVYKKPIADFIEPLIVRVNTYHAKFQKAA